MSPAPIAEPLRRGTLRFKQHGVAVTLEVLEGVFSATAVDAGTRHLLRWLAAERYSRARSVLDVGCGYGPLGLWLAAADPRRHVVAVDRDARALAATELGAVANGVDDRVAVRAGLGYDDLGGDERFDLIVSNVPAKVGDGALAHLLLDACFHLTPGGSVAVVVVDRLAATAGGLLADPAVEMLDARPSRAYTAYEYRFDGIPAGASAATALERGAYRRGRHAFGSGSWSWEAEVAWSVPEFDNLGHGSRAALELLPGALPGTGGVVAVWGVGQGHLALAARAMVPGIGLRLVDRDLLALRTAGANVGPVAREVRHRPLLGPDDVVGVDAVVVELPEREPVAVTAAWLGPALAARPGLVVLLHGRAADLSRVAELLGRHGARLEVDGSATVRRHAAVLGRVRTSAATPPG